MMILALQGIVWAGPQEEIQVNKTVSGQNWDFTVISIQNTGRQSWEVETYRLNQYKSLNVKDENLCSWRLKIKAGYKNLEREDLTFRSDWIDVRYTTKEMASSVPRNIIGVIMHPSFLDKMSGGIELTPQGPRGTPLSPISMDLLFLAPKNTEEITKKFVAFLDYPEVQIISLQQKEEIGGKPK